MTFYEVRSISHYQTMSVLNRRPKESTPVFCDVLLLENGKEQKTNTIGSVKLNKVLHSGIFKEHVHKLVLDKYCSTIYTYGFFLVVEWSMVRTV